jgi:signal peptidase I
VRLVGNRSKSTLNSVIELIVIIAIALGLALAIQAVIVKPYRIPSGSMEPTLSVGQRVLVNRIGMDIKGPKVGEIVVFHPPVGAQQSQCGEPRHPMTAACAKPIPKEDNSTNFIKRIVAAPGDEMYVSEGHVFRKAKGTATFVKESDSYIKPCAQEVGVVCNLTKAIKIPPDHWFMMGDNRGESDDSRFWGPVPEGWIIGGAFFTYWPPKKIGFL